MVRVKSGGQKKIHSSPSPGVHDILYGGNSFVLLDLGTLGTLFNKTPVIVIQVF